MKGEIWKPVRNYEGLYEVSNLGRVRSLERKVWNSGKGCYVTVPERILKAGKAKGYLRVRLYKEGKVKNYYVHRLVGQEFLENPMGYTELNHLDEDKENNRADNLEFCSKSYNINYGTRNKRVAEKVSEKLKGKKHSEEHNKKVSEKLKGRKQTEEHIKKRSKPVFSVNKESGLIMWWKSAKEAERCTGIDHGNIIKCCKGKYNSAGNHIWFYADDDNE